MLICLGGGTYRVWSRGGKRTGDRVGGENSRRTSSVSSVR